MGPDCVPDEGGYRFFSFFFYHGDLCSAEFSEMKELASKIG